MKPRDAGGAPAVERRPGEVRIGVEHGTRGWRRVAAGILAVLSVPTAVILVISVEGWWAKLTFTGVMAFGCWVLFSAAFRLTIPLPWHRALESGAGVSTHDLTPDVVPTDDSAVGRTP